MSTKESDQRVCRCCKKIYYKRSGHTVEWRKGFDSEFGDMHICKKCGAGMRSMGFYHLHPYIEKLAQLKRQHPFLTRRDRQYD